MGRPLNKKFFGNRNPGLDGDFGAQNQAGDAGLGGTGIASIVVTDPGTGWATQPTYVVQIPTLPDGIRAEVVPHYRAISASTATNGKGYNFGDAFTIPSAAEFGAPAQVSVTAITAVGVTMITPGDHYNNGDILEYRTGQVGNVAIRVTTVGSASDAPAESLTIVDGGARSAVKPTGNLSYQNSLGGTGITFTLDWGVYSATVDAAGLGGDYTTFPSNPASAFGIATEFFTPATFNLTSGLRSITVTNPGDGYAAAGNNYISSDDAPFVNFSGTGDPSFTVNLTRTGQTNVNRGIFVYGYQAGTGMYSSDIAVPVDIIKQQSSRRYKIRERKWKSLTAANYGTLTANNTTGAFTISTPQPAGTFVAGQLLVIHGTLGGVGSFSYYYNGAAFQITATNGTSTFTLERQGSPITTVAGAVTGATLVGQTPHDTVVERSAKLVAHWPSAPGEIAIIACDATYSLYFVTKLTARRAQLVPINYFNTQWLYPPIAGAYQSVAWTLDPNYVFEAHSGVGRVQIGNYDIFVGP